MLDLTDVLARTAAGARAELDLDQVVLRAHRIRRHRRITQALVAGTTAAALALVTGVLLRPGSPSSLEQTTPVEQPTHGTSPAAPNEPTATAVASGASTPEPIAATSSPSGGAAGAPEAATVAPTGWVVFAGRLEGATTDAIHRMRADGSQLRRLAAGIDPAWSPDGAQVAYASGGEVWVVGVDGGLPRQVTSLPTDSATTPSWSPDGGRIAFVAKALPNGVDTPQAGIQVVGADGRGQRALTNGTSWDESPTWSPDGKRLAFLRGGAPYLIGADGSHEQALQGVGRARGPMSWSPDGTRIALVAEDASMGSGHLFAWTLHIGRDAATKVGASSDGGRVVWSPDARSLAWDSAGVVVADLADASGARRVTPSDRCPAEGDGDPCESVQEWTREERLLVAYRHRTAGDPYGELLTLRPDGSDRRRVLGLVSVEGLDWVEGDGS